MVAFDPNTNSMVQGYFEYKMLSQIYYVNEWYWIDFSTSQGVRYINARLWFSTHKAPTEALGIENMI